MSTCKKKNNVGTKKNTIFFNNYICLFFFPIFHPAQLRPGPASLAGSTGVNEAADSGRRCKSEPGQQRPCEIVHKRVCFHPLHPCFFSPTHSFSVVWCSWRTQAGGGEEVGRGVNNIQLRYMTQIKDAVCDAAAY